MSLEVFRDRIKRLARNPSSIAARIKPAKFEGVAERAYRELIAKGEATAEAVASFPDAAILKWLNEFRSTFPVNFGATPQGTASARLDEANANPPQQKPNTPTSPKMDLTPAKAKWLSAQRPEIKLAIASGQMRFPGWLVEMEENK